MLAAHTHNIFDFRAKHFDYHFESVCFCFQWENSENFSILIHLFNEISEVKKRKKHFEWKSHDNTHRMTI